MKNGCPLESDFARTERGSRNADDIYLNAVIHAYFDDSADPLMNEYAVCGGVLGEAFHMTVIENLWVRATRHLEQPFRSTDCECQKGQFEKWEKSDCNQLMQNLVDILCSKPPVAAFATAVDIQLYREIFPNSHRDDPYRLALRHVLVGLVRLCRKNSHRAKCWFESGANDADILRAYNDVRDHVFLKVIERNQLAGISFGDKTLAPLQAADLAARESLKASQNRGIRKTRKPLSRMWNNAGMVELGQECLLKLRDKGGPFSMKALDELGSDCYMEEIRDNAFSRTALPV
ncbi:MAG: hypothetical protein JWQ49_2503 [Edaphobacter sp.]|nr:hypothetical protein [Edaphobacter sp.]